jgi:alpha-galactosidase
MLIERSDWGFNLVLEVAPEAPVRLLHVGSAAFANGMVPEDKRWAYRLVEVRAAGEDHDYIEAGRYAGSAVGGRLRYIDHDEDAATIRIRQRDPVSGLEALTTLTGGDGVLETHTSLTNTGAAPIVLQAVSSFFLAGFSKVRTQPMSLATAVHIPRNSWYAEFQWTRVLADQLGLNSRWGFGSRHETISSVGNWCSSNYLPMGALENVDAGDWLVWEVLHGGSWSWQVSDVASEIYVHVAGPTEAESSWFRTLAPGESFTTVTCAIAPAHAFDSAIGALTRHRRRTRRTQRGAGPVVFNDYMNCLMGDPSEAATLPLIETAARLGAEVYCIDAGWYAPPGVRWSNTLGTWNVNPERFPQGLCPIFDRIREQGMVPGLWFEIEAMTDNCPGRDQLPRDWFFERHGRAVQSHRRLQLDFRNPAVRQFARDSVRPALEAGARYLKLDYNFTSGAGSELGAESLGEALLDYQRGFLGWLDDLREAYPDLMIEHCASGGLRLARPYLDRVANASHSDEGDPLQIARIAAAAPTILLPEQNGTWVLPAPDQEPAMIALTVLSGILGRPLLAGRSERLSAAQIEILRQGVRLYKELRSRFAQAVPAWPIGLPGYHADWICLALHTPDEVFVAVWKRGKEDTPVAIPLGTRTNVELIFPAGGDDSLVVRDSVMHLSGSGPFARLFRCT